MCGNYSKKGIDAPATCNKLFTNLLQGGKRERSHREQKGLSLKYYFCQAFSNPFWTLQLIGFITTISNISQISKVFARFTFTLCLTTTHYAAAHSTSTRRHYTHAQSWGTSWPNVHNYSAERAGHLPMHNTKLADRGWKGRAKNCECHLWMSRYVKKSGF